ncbi:MAG TPA: amidohydrolase family protein [Trueperaceae bacterium]|nr:amidohydrolase family protein [Trueperaceae bacterium]
MSGDDRPVDDKPVAARTIDVHCHVIVPEMLRGPGGAEAWRPDVTWEDGQQVVEFRGKRIRSAVREFVRVERILEEAASEGVDHVVLSPWVNLLPFGLELPEALDVCALQNEALSRLARDGAGRVSALGVVPLQDPERAAEELTRAMRLPGVLGVETSASVQGRYLGDDRFEPFWAAAEETGALVFVHPTTRGFGLPVFDDYYMWNAVANPMETAVTGAHMVLAGVLERHPRLRVLLAHGGGALLALRGRLRHAASFQPQARARLQGDLDASLRRFYYDTVTFDEDLLGALVGYVGAERVLLGSDRPFDMGTARPVEEVRALGLPAEQERAILAGNAGALIREAAGSG